MQVALPGPGRVWAVRVDGPDGPVRIGQDEVSVTDTALVFDRGVRVAPGSPVTVDWTPVP